MVKRYLFMLVLCATVAACKRDSDALSDASPQLDGVSVTDESPQLAQLFRDGEPAWESLEADLQAGRFWTHWRYVGRSIIVHGLPVSGRGSNPLLINTYDKPIWLHVALSHEQSHRLRTYPADSCSVIVAGPVKAINWYSKHIWVRAVFSDTWNCN